MSSYEIKVGTSRTGERVIQLHGEFDLLALRELSETIGQEAGPGCATVLDLSGVTFADLCTLRELSRALLRHSGLSLRAPSWQVMHSARVCGLGDMLRPEEILAETFVDTPTGISRKAS